jgi:hypothetical protein
MRYITTLLFFLVACGQQPSSDPVSIAPGPSGTKPDTISYSTSQTNTHCVEVHVWTESNPAGIVIPACVRHR